MRRVAAVLVGVIRPLKASRVRTVERDGAPQLSAEDGRNTAPGIKRVSMESKRGRDQRAYCPMQGGHVPAWRCESTSRHERASLWAGRVRGETEDDI